MLKKYIYASIFILFLSSKISFAGTLYGKGELKMSEKAVDGFIQYIKINKIEFITHQNSSYLKNLYSLYFPISKEIIIPNVISLNQLKKTDQNVKLVNTKN